MSKESRRSTFEKRRSSSRHSSVQRKSFLQFIAARKNSKAKLVRTYQPTYQLEPHKKFNEVVVERIIKKIINTELEDVEYSDKLIPELCARLSETIRDAVKEENYDRYRILSSVTIIQRRQQGVQMFHSFLWDPERDGFACYNYEGCNMLANAVVYGIYLD